MTPDTIVLPIHRDYVPDWGKWEVVRELVQNAVDQARSDGDGCEFGYDHQRGRLEIYNQYATISRGSLLFGKTDKADDDRMRGQFGEGLKLAMLAGVREDMNVLVRTGRELWTPKIERVASFDTEECLVVEISKNNPQVDYVKVSVRLSEDDWKTLKRRLLFIEKPKDVIETSKGRIILDDDHKGNVYSKGIFITHMEKLNFGYDLDSVKLDRDRRLVDVFDLQWILGTMFNEAIEKRPERMNLDVYKMIRDGKEDTRQFRYLGDVSSKERIADAFREEYGEDAVPVASASDVKDMERYGRKAVVNPHLSDALAGHLDASVVRADANNLIKTKYRWVDLTNEERDNLFEFVQLIDRATESDRDGDCRPLGFGMDTETPERLLIVDFRSDTMEGFSSGDSFTVMIARRLLTNRTKLLQVLVREEAYVLGSRGRGYAGHVGKSWGDQHIELIGRIWASVFFRI
jgi:hypothetical protein